MSEEEDDKLLVTSSELVNFLEAKGRSIKCPFCQYSGPWMFHLKPNKLAPNGERYLNFYKTPSLHGAGYMPMLAVSCPSCAHLTFLDASTVLQFLGRLDLPGDTQNEQ